MKLVSFSIERYRSITRAYRLPVGQWTVLIGPNNEGKSNILRALATVMSTLSQQRYTVLRPGSRPRLPASAARRSFVTETDYDWHRDFPMPLQSKLPEGESVFTVEFELTEEEIQDFRTEVGSRLNGTLPIEVSVGAQGASFRVIKKGPGAAALSKKAVAISGFVADRLEFQYIPAVRTAASALRIVEQMVDRALRTIERDPAYQEALAHIKDLQQPVLAEISATIRDTLTEFLPLVRNVDVEISDEARSGAFRRSCEIIVDDGTATQLRYKGDGVQSIAALSLMRHASERSASGRNLVLAIEEPESHLHPHAIHQLRAVLQDIALSRQIFMTTHNPLFVDRMTPANNIVVSKNRAERAPNIRRIREVLGVRASDNLRNADLVLVVEGEDDIVALRALLAHASPRLREALAEGAVAIDSLLGAGNLAYKLSQLRDALCASHAFMDDDRAGRQSVERAIADGLLTLPDVTMCVVDGCPEAEIEDLYDRDIYEQLVLARYGVSLASPRFRTASRWSERMKGVFRQQGKPWSDAMEAELKIVVANAVAANPGNALLPARRSSFDALVASLEAKLPLIAIAGRS